MTRAAKTILLALGASLAVTALCVVYRAPLLESLLRAALAVREVPNVMLRVESVGWHGAVIADLALGSGGEFRARRIAVAYDLSAPGELLAGRLRSVTLEGVELALDLRGERPALGSLHHLTAGSDAEDGGPIPPLPLIEFKDARVRALTPIGPVAGEFAAIMRPGGGGALLLSATYAIEANLGRLSGELEANRAPDGRTEARLVLADGALDLPGAQLSELRGRGAIGLVGGTPMTASLDLTLGGIAIPGAAFEQAQLTLRMAGPRLDLDAALATADGKFTAHARAGLDDFLGQPRGDLTLEAEAEAQSVIWKLLALPAPTAGRIKLVASAQGRLPPLADLRDRKTATLTELRPTDFTGGASLRLHNMTFPDQVEGLSGEVVVNTDAPDAPGELAAAVNLTLSAASFSQDELQATKLALAQTFQIQVEDEKVALNSINNGKISADEFQYGLFLASEGPVSAQVTANHIKIDLGNPDGFVLTHDINLAPDEIHARVLDGDGGGLAVAARAKQVRATGTYRADEGYAGRIEVVDGGLAAPDHQVEAERLYATVELARDNTVALDFTLGALRHIADTPMLAPLSLRGALRQSAEAIDFSVTGAGPDGVGEISLTGRHRTAPGAGTAQIALTPLSFAPGGAQPGTLFPALADLRDVTGQARAEAALSWIPKAVTGTAALTIENVSLTSAAAQIEGLSLDLALTQLRPPGSAPGQTLRVRRIDPGVPLDGLTLRFQVVPGDSPAIAIEDAGLSLAGGRFSLADLLVDPANTQHDLPMKVEDLDLAEVFALLGIDGISGNGRLSGTIPIVIREGAPSIVQGRLAAQGPGILRVRSDYAKQALSAAGESAELLLQALADFHYQELSLTIDQPSENLAVLGLSMLGNNPDVLEGYPFRFNINLETDPTKLLVTLQEAYRISNRAIGQMWMFGR